MARKFKCSHCGEDIIVKHLWPGEDANCQSCGKENTVPEDFETVPDEEYDKFQESKASEIEQDYDESTIIPALQVNVSDISMTFSSMVVFMVKWAFASIPAIIILFLIGLMLFAITGIALSF